MTTDATDDGRIGQFLEVPHIVAAEAEVEHGGQDDIDEVPAGRAIVSRLLLPVAFANQCRLMDFRARQTGDRLRQMATVAHAHVAPLVGYAAREALGGAPQRADQFSIGASHAKRITRSNRR